jgi:hypothetical protein
MSASRHKLPFHMATSADLVFPDTRGIRPDRFEESVQFESALFRAAVVDPVVHKAMIEVGQLLEPRTPLRAPQTVQRIGEANAFA